MATGRGSDEVVEIRGLRELRRGLRTIDRTAPRELNRALVKAMGPIELVASARTPRVTGGMQALNRVATRGDRVVLRNTHPGANAVHWGRKFWPNKRSARRVPSSVKAQPWLYVTVVEQRDVIVRYVARELEQALERHLGSSS